MNKLFCFLILSMMVMCSCSRNEPKSTQDLNHMNEELTQNLNQLTMRLIEVKQNWVLSQCSKILAESNAQNFYGIAAFPEGIANPGKPTLVSYKSLDKGQIERLEFPENHRKLASQLYEILQANDVLDKIAFVDFRGVTPEEQLAVHRLRNPTEHAGPIGKSGLNAIRGDSRTQLCLSSAQLKGWYCRSWGWNDECHCYKCNLCDETT
jgi:hypothetical protein